MSADLASVMRLKQFPACEASGICGRLINGTTDVCGPCTQRHTAPPHDIASTAAAQSPETVESSPGNALTVTLGDIYFLVGFGVVIGLALALAVFVVSVAVTS